MSIIKIKYWTKVAGYDEKRHCAYTEDAIRTEHIESNNWRITYTPTKNWSVSEWKERDFLEYNEHRIYIKDIIWLMINGKTLINNEKEVINFAEFTST